MLRRIDGVPWWSFPLARHLFARERRALAIAGRARRGAAAPVRVPAGTGARLDRRRGAAYRQAARRARLFPLGQGGACASCTGAGICHNDLAKEQNWLRGNDGRAYLTDFQLAMRFSRRSRLFRIAAYEDLRHLLKHKRRYAPEALTPAERRVLANKSVITRVWMATGKKVYYSGHARPVCVTPTVKAAVRASCTTRRASPPASRPTRRCATS